jgi:hypothetical protein
MLVMNRNTPRFDEPNQRIFIAGRTSGKFFVFNATTGRSLPRWIA